MDQLQETVNKAREGDQEAFTEVYRTFTVPIFKYVFYRVGVKEEAEDLTQKIFVKVWKSISKFKDQKNTFTTWLYTIAKNTIIDHWRRKENKYDYFGLDSILDLSDDRRSADRLVIQNEANDEIQEYIRKLSVDQQQIIVLKFIQELTNKEISQITGKSEESIRSIQYRALKKMRKIVKK